MQSALGLIGFVLYIAVIVAAAAGVTWLVVKISPAKKPSETPPV